MRGTSNVRGLGKRCIQGGMGAGVSPYYLAREVSKDGRCLGVVSGTALANVMARRLQLGDIDGEVRSALMEFPNKDVASKIIEKYFVDGGKPVCDKFESVPFPKLDRVGDDPRLVTLANKDLEGLIIAANFVEVNLAKRGHDNPVGVNYLHKIKWPLLPAIYGSMLAGVDTALIGAGLPREISEVLDNFSKGRGVVAPLSVTSDRDFSISFDPKDVMGEYKELVKPAFLGIVTEHLAARALSNVDGYVIEGNIAGGHNAPARSKSLNENGEPAYGLKDEMNFEKFKRKLNGRPYFLAGGYAGRLNEALDSGASGIQIGSVFAFCRESGMQPDLRGDILRQIMEGGGVYTDPRASPSGFPFKVFQSEGTLSSQAVRDRQKARCNRGYLVELYEDDGRVLTRCPAEPEDSYVKKGGDGEDMKGRVCLCNGLMSTIGLGDFGVAPIVTAGSELEDVRKLVELHGFDYTAKNVVDYVFRNAA